MSAVRSKGNKSTERRLRAYLVKWGVRGWRLQPKDIAGKPDFAFDAQRVVVFVDGCFWHKCPICCRMPHTRQDYWGPKIEGNYQRDLKTTQMLTEVGWVVLRFWEHEVRNDPRGVVDRIGTALQRAESGWAQV
jgi:DNA mismatch endonuclease (patch repair protein)